MVAQTTESGDRAIHDPAKDGLGARGQRRIPDGQQSWAENTRDWSISRNHYWGSPIPVWKSDEPVYPRVDLYGSLDELAADFGVEVAEVHRPGIDLLTRPNPDDPTGKVAHAPGH